MPEEYIIGTTPVPDWCADKLMPYRKLDGQTGWELHGRRRTYELDEGDVLCFDEYGGIGVVDWKRYREGAEL